MPIMSCTLPSGKRGYKWGSTGKCYPTRTQAMKQAAAIRASQQEKSIKKIFKNLIHKLFPKRFTES